MASIRRRLIISLPIIATVLLLLASVAAGVGSSTITTIGLTPSPYAHLPFVAIPPPPTPTCPCTTLIPPDDLEIEQFIATRFNELRVAAGLPALTLVPELTQAARRHVRDMADANFTGHTGSDDSNVGQRMQEAGYYWSWRAEIIGWGFGGAPERMIDWWMNSEIHRSMILSAKAQDFGVGYARNADSDWGHYWTVDFGKRDSVALLSPDGLSICTGIAQGRSGGSSVSFASLEPCQ